MKKILVLSIITATGALLMFGCKKSDSNATDNAKAIIGKWRYGYSTEDTMINGQWQGQLTGYDSSIGPNFADSLQFTATDTVYYIYNGYITWSNYKVSGNNLILIGGGASDTLTIHSLSDNTLWVGEQTPTFYYWAGFGKYQ